jgi:hypothetical protein
MRVKILASTPKETASLMHVSEPLQRLTVEELTQHHQKPRDIRTTSVGLAVYQGTR